MFKITGWFTVGKDMFSRLNSDVKYAYSVLTLGGSLCAADFIKNIVHPNLGGILIDAVLVGICLKSTNFIRQKFKPLEHC